MPASSTRYDHSTSSYRITCQSCGTYARSNSIYDEDANDLERPGQRISVTFRWLRTPYRWQYLCRSCEREYNRTRRARAASRRQNRVPGTSRAPMGTTRRFGVELECGIPSSVGRSGIRDGLATAGVTGWTIKGDGSLSLPGMEGVEIVSPPLSGDDGEQQVRTVCRVLRGLGATVNRTCGTHVHHDVNDLTVDELKSVARGWFNNRRLIDGLVAPSRRPGGSQYCEPLRDTEIASIEAATNLDEIRGLYISRYRTFNLTSYGRYGTVEIRQHQGTLDAEKVISWTRLGQALIDTAKVEASPLMTRSSVRELFAGLGDRLDETARTFLTGRAVEFGSVAV